MPLFKAALVKIVMLTMEQSTVNNDKAVTSHTTLSRPQFCRAFLASFSSLFWVSACSFTVLAVSQCSHQCCLQTQTDLRSEKEAQINLFRVK